jgi:predicted acetyltransferase
MADLELVTVDRDDLPAFLATMRRLFGQSHDPARSVPDMLGRATMARVDGVAVGTAAVLHLNVNLPGGARVPMDGVTAVVVAPTARRRGVLRAMMDRLLVDARERGAALLGLGATESSIYRRFGYGVASFAGELQVETAYAGLRSSLADPGRLRSVLPEEALPIWTDVEARQTQRVGAIDRHPGWWGPEVSGARSPAEHGILQVVVHEDGSGVVDGFVNYRQQLRWHDGVADGLTRVHTFASLNRTAHLALWQHLFRLDLSDHLETDRFWLDDPIQHLLADPRRLRVIPRDDLHLRVVDVVAVLQARRYSREDALVIEVRDPQCPDVAGRYYLEAGVGGAGAARTDAASDIVLDAAALGSVLLGDVSVAALYAAGLVHEATPGAVRRASAMFAWQPRPWLTYMF